VVVRGGSGQQLTVKTGVAKRRGKLLDATGENWIIGVADASLQVTGKESRL